MIVSSRDDNDIVELKISSLYLFKTTFPAQKKRSFILKILKNMTDKQAQWRVLTSGSNHM